MSELLTQWLIDLKEQGLVSNDEVHQAAPEGKNLVGNRYIFNHHIWSETFDRPSEKGQQVWRSLPQLEEWARRMRSVEWPVLLWTFQWVWQHHRDVREDRNFATINPCYSIQNSSFSGIPANYCWTTLCRPLRLLGWQMHRLSQKGIVEGGRHPKGTAGH